MLWLQSSCGPLIQLSAISGHKRAVSWGGSRLCDSGAMAAGQPYGQVRLWVEGKVCATLHGAAPFPVLCWSCGSGVRELWVPLLWGYPIGKEGCFLTSKVGGDPKRDFGAGASPSPAAGCLQLVWSPFF